METQRPRLADELCGVMTGFNTRNGFFFFWVSDKPCCDLQWSSNGYSQHTARHISTLPYAPHHPAALPQSFLSASRSASRSPSPVSPRWFRKRLIDCCLSPGWAEGSAVRQSPELKDTVCQGRQNRQSCWYRGTSARVSQRQAVLSDVLLSD